MKCMTIGALPAWQMAPQTCLCDAKSQGARRKSRRGLIYNRCEHSVRDARAESSTLTCELLHSDNQSNTDLARIERLVK